MDVSRAALHRVITTVGLLYEPGAPPFPQRVLAVVRGLIDADSGSYNDIAAPTRALGWRVEPAGVGEFPDAAAAFTAHLFEHPLLAHYQATGDGSAMRISPVPGPAVPQPGDLPRVLPPRRGRPPARDHHRHQRRWAARGRP